MQKISSDCGKFMKKKPGARKRGGTAVLIWHGRFRLMSQRERKEWAE